ncbi:MAG: hypothetical protein QF464_16350, partial [Myxococcota bacterium]|nr:hypothetical protein [Myxococcota bacterium]
WRAYLGEGEGEAIGAGLRAGSAPRELLGRLEESLVARGAMVVLAQHQDRCAMLQADAPACTLQGHGGLDALPAACRDFPRSVVATPAGWEVAFTLACPTACRLAVSAEGPYQLVSRGAEGWPYPPRRDIPDVLPVTTRQAYPWHEVESLRADWWLRLSEEAAEAVTAMRCLRFTPLLPHKTRKQRGLQDPRGLAVEQIRTLYQALLSIGQRGERYQATKRELWERLSRPPSGETLEVAIEARGAWVLRLLAVWIQAAGVHDGSTVAAGLLAAYERAVVTVCVAEALEAMADVSSAEAIRDAALATSHLTAMGRHAQRVI